MAETRPPKRRMRLNCNDPEAWRYHVLRNGERITNARNANAATGEIEVFRMMEQKNVLTGEMMPTNLIMPLDRADSDRFAMLAVGVVEIVRMVPPVGTVPWDDEEPEPEVSVQEPLLMAPIVEEEIKEEPKVVEEKPAPASVVAAKPAQTLSLGLDFGD